MTNTPSPITEVLDQLRNGTGRLLLQIEADDGTRWLRVNREARTWTVWNYPGDPPTKLKDEPGLPHVFPRGDDRTHEGGVRAGVVVLQTLTYEQANQALRRSGLALPAVGRLDESAFADWHRVFEALDELPSSGSPAQGGAKPPRTDERRPPRRSKLHALYTALGTLWSKETQPTLDALIKGRVDRIRSEFVAAVSDFAPYKNLQDGFGRGLASRKELTGERNRDTPNTQAVVDAVATDGLRTADGRAYTFVDYEIKPDRTRGFERHRSPSADLLLRGDDGVPALCEIKVRTDRDCTYALIQLLSYASMLVTSPQVERLQKYYAKADLRLPALGDVPAEPWLDLVILVCDPKHCKSDHLTRVRELADLLLEPGAGGVSSIASYIREIRCLEMKWSDRTVEERFVTRSRPTSAPPRADASA